MQVQRVDIPFGAGRSIPAAKYINPTAATDAPLWIFAPGRGEQMRDEKINATTLASSYVNMRDNPIHAPLIKYAETHGFHVLMPLFVQAWNGWEPDWYGGTYMEACIDWAVANMPISSKRVDLVGFSSGGCAVLDAVTRNQRLSGKIAGVVACAPGNVIKPDWKLIKDNNIPIWIFHCEDDLSEAPYKGGLAIYEILKSLQINPEPRFTHPTTGKHGGAPQVAFNLQEMYTTALEWRSDYVPEEPPTKKILTKIYFPDGAVMTVCDDKSTKLE